MRDFRCWERVFPHTLIGLRDAPAPKHAPSSNQGGRNHCFSAGEGDQVLAACRRWRDRPSAGEGLDHCLMAVSVGHLEIAGDEREPKYLGQSNVLAVVGSQRMSELPDPVR